MSPNCQSQTEITAVLLTVLWVPFSPLSGFVPLKFYEVLFTSLLRKRKLPCLWPQNLDWWTPLQMLGNAKLKYEHGKFGSLFCPLEHLYWLCRGIMVGFLGAPALPWLIPQAAPQQGWELLLISMEEPRNLPGVVWFVLNSSKQRKIWWETIKIHMENF